MRNPNSLIASVFALLSAIISSNAYASPLATACVNAIYSKYPDAELDLSTAQVHDGWVSISDIYMKENRRPYKYHYPPYDIYPWSCTINRQAIVKKIHRPIDADRD